LLTAAANLSPELGRIFEIANIDLWDITGNSYSYTENYEREAPGGSPIEIINRYGNVLVTPADTDRIVVNVAKTVVASNQAEADQLAPVLTYSIVEEGGRYRVISSLNRDENRIRGRRFKTSLTIQVPRRSSLTVNNREGDVEISGITGDQQVRNSFGSVAVRGITGTVDIVTSHNSAVVEDISGAVKVTNEFGQVEARRITGDLETKNQNSGITISEIKGKTTIDNSFGSIEAGDIQGSLSIDARMTSVEVKKVEGDVTVENEFHSVNVEDPGGQVRIDTKHSNVALRYLKPPRKDIRIDNQFGDVTVVLPSTSAFSINANARSASVSTDFSELSRRENEPNRETLTGQVGSGGPEIRIDNQNGNIQIRM
jgi:hypothetical protein